MPDQKWPDQYQLGDLTPVDHVYFNVRQNIITITEDKLRLCLEGNIRRTGKRNAWISPLGILVALGICLVTADFKEFIFKPATWQAIFVIAGVFVLVWLVWTLYQHCKSETVSALIEKIKGTVEESRRPQNRRK